MASLSRQKAIDVVDAMLREHLPWDWLRHVKLEPAAMRVPAREVDAHDLEWLIRRPEDENNSLRYYRLRLLGNSGSRFLVIYGNTDIGVGPIYEKAMVFDQWRAKLALDRLVSQPSEYPPNQYGFT